MTISQLKEEQRAKNVLTTKAALDKMSPEMQGAIIDWLNHITDTFADKVVDAVEGSVMPEEKEDDGGFTLAGQHGLHGFNTCRTQVKEAFKTFRT